MEAIRRITCLVCGTQELTSAEYMRQMDRPDSRWICPKCGKTALWDGEYYPCIAPGCDGLASVDTDTCDKCGRSQMELYEAMEGQS